MTKASMTLTLPAAFAYLLLVLGEPASAAVKIWSIYWATPWMPCGDGVMLTGVSTADPNSWNTVPCTFYANTPWDHCQPITIIGYNIVHEVTNLDTRTWLMVGSAHPSGGADVFAQTGGDGQTQHGMMYPPPYGIQQGGNGISAQGAHLDVYGSCP